MTKQKGIKKATKEKFFCIAIVTLLFTLLIILPDILPLQS